MKPNQRVSDIAFSATLALDAKAKKLKAEGRDVVNMSAGEPDFDAPEAVRAASHVAVDSGQVRYTPAAGRPALRQVIADHLAETRGGEWTPAEVTVCHSCKHALSGTLLTLICPGDEILIPLPAWVSYFDIVGYAGGVAVGVEPRAECAPDLDALEAAVTDKTRGVLLNSPSNPSGYVLPADEVRRIVEIAEKHDLWIVSDEIYRRLVFDGASAPSPVSVSPAARARTIIVDGASKAYAMTGYRIGFLTGPQEITSSVARLHSQLTGAPNAISQDAYAAALRAEPREVSEMVNEYATRRDAFVAGLRGIGLALPVPKGAFYVFPDVSPYLDERGSAGFCEDLLEERDLAAVPGSVFGLDGHIRMSYATSLEMIEEATRRLGAFLTDRKARLSVSNA